MTYHFTFRPFFLVLNFVDFDKKPSLSRKSVFSRLFCSLQSLNGSVYYTWSSTFYMFAHLRAESAIIFPRSSVQALSALYVAEGTQDALLTV